MKKLLHTAKYVNKILEFYKNLKFIKHVKIYEQWLLLYKKIVSKIINKYRELLIDAFIVLCDNLTLKSFIPKPATNKISFVIELLPKTIHIFSFSKNNEKELSREKT